jgi:hypothetical protein
MGISTQGTLHSYASNSVCASGSRLWSEVRPQARQNHSCVCGFHRMFLCFIGPCAIPPAEPFTFTIHAAKRWLRTQVERRGDEADFFSSFSIADSICRASSSFDVAFASNCALAALMSSTSKDGAL